MLVIINDFRLPIHPVIVTKPGSAGLFREKPPGALALPESGPENGGNGSEKEDVLPSHKYQTVKGDTHMNRTLMFIALIIGFAVLAGLSVTSKATESVGNVVDDTVITTTVKAELAKDIRLGTLTGIEVSTTQGVVTLAGKVRNSEEKAIAEQKARGVTGVVKVTNELQVVSPPQKK
jgi:hypothetical protein